MSGIDFFRKIDQFFGKVFFTVLGSLFLFPGGYALYWAGVEFLEWQDAKSWPVADGRFVDSRVSGGGAAIAYSSEVGGLMLESERVFIGEYKGIESHTNALVEKYSTGASVPVYYKLDDPAASVLEHAFHWSYLPLAGIGAVFVYEGFRRFRSRRGISEVAAQIADDA